MTVAELLNRSRTMDKELRQLREVKARAYELACAGSVNMSGEKVQNSNQNSAEHKFAAYVEYSRQVDDMTAELIECRGILLNILNKMQNKTYKMLLIERYINCQTWDNVAEKIGLKDVRHVYRLHKKALKSAQNIT